MRLREELVSSRTRARNATAEAEDLRSKNAELERQACIDVAHHRFEAAHLKFVRQRLEDMMIDRDRDARQMEAVSEELSKALRERNSALRERDIAMRKIEDMSAWILQRPSTTFRVASQPSPLARSRSPRRGEAAAPHRREV